MRAATGLDVRFPRRGLEEWTAGVALERRDGPTGRWSSVRRQELTGADPAHFAARLHGWEAGLLDRAEKLARRERL